MWPARFHPSAIRDRYPPFFMVPGPLPPLGRGRHRRMCPMTPQERQLVAELFDRLASLERGPRDPDAERAIAEGFKSAPNAAYALVQTVLVQDEALKRANARIEELEAQFAGETPHEGGGFLDS